MSDEESEQQGDASCGSDGILEQPTKKTKVEEEEEDVNPSTVQYYTGFTSIGGDPNLLLLNSTAIPSSYNNNYYYHSNKPHTILHLGKGGTLIQPDQHQQPQRMPPLFMQQQMSLGSFPGSGLSPGFQEEGGSYYYYGYPGYAASTALHHDHPASTTSNNNGGGGGSNFTPNYNDAGGNVIAEGDDHQQQHQQHQFEQIRPMGMTPLVFSGLPANFQLSSLHSVGGGLSGGGVGGGFYEYNASANAYHPGLLQVVSTEDGTMIDGGGGGGTIASNGTTVPYHHFRMVPMPAMGSAVAPLQQPKKWVRWSEDEDRILGQAVEQYGENNFRHISEQVFQGTRTEQQCKNRWKKALQPGLVKGRWTKEEDDIITASVTCGDTAKWNEIAKRLPGRIGEQVKERWINVLDPDMKKGLWTQAEMKILRDSQKELGNKWSEIAKRIPGRNENSVKNRWYNQKTTDKKMLKKRSAEGSTPSGSQSGSEQAYTPSQSQQSIMSGGPVMHIYHQQQPHHHYHQQRKSEEYDDEEYDDDDDAYNNMFEDEEKKEEVEQV